MDKISINLLPLEILAKERQSAKVILINRISFGLLLLLIFLTSAMIALRILQGKGLKILNDDLALIESSVQQLKDKEIYALALKYRLGSIEKLSFDPKKVSIFNLVISLSPQDVTISQVNVDKTSIVNLTLSSFSLKSIDELIQNLARKDMTSDLIARLDLESFARGQDGLFRLSIKVTPR